MAELSTLETLRRRKQLLVARSEIQRLTLALEAARIREATAWVPTAAEWVRGAAPWLLIAAPVAGFLLGRKPRSVRSLVAKAIWGWGIYRRIARSLAVFGKG